MSLLCEKKMVCTQEDDFTEECRDKALARWVVELSDGTKVYQDDNRPSLQEKSAWKRLNLYLRERYLNIINIWLEFRSNSVTDIVPKNARGYFFCKKLSCDMGEKERNNYVIGYIEGDKIKTKTYQVPELILIEVGERELKQSDFLIINPNQAK